LPAWTSGSEGSNANRRGRFRPAGIRSSDVLHGELVFHQFRRECQTSQHVFA
jgi:hypothetical protein